MSDLTKKTDALQQLVSILEAAQLADGSLGLTLRGPEPLFGNPIPVKLQFCSLDELCAELSEISVGLHAIADALRKQKK